MYQDENGKLKGVVIKSNGETEEFDVVTAKSPEQCLVTDGKGDSLVITSKGQPMGISEYRATGGNKAMLNDYHRKLDSTANFQLNFLPSDKQKYAFDYLGSGDHGIYLNSECCPKSGSYDFRYKSIETGKTDYVKVDFSNYNGLKDSVIFKDRYGIKLKLSNDNILTFTGTQKPDTNYIYAYDKEGVKIGKLMLKTYTPKIYNIVLVSVNGEKLPYTNKLKDYLNQIYNQLVTKFEINTTTLEIKDLLPFKHGDKKRLSGYNEDQKRVLQAFDSQAKDDINYLFFMPDGVETNGVAGYNPFGYNFGFIYHGAGMRTIAHELGHGIGSLTHPFDDQTRDQAKTANLMDYNDKEELYHFQWNAIQNPPKRIFKWNFEEEDAEAYGNNSHYICLSETYVNKLKESGYRYYYLPDGKVADYKDYRPSGFYTKEDGTSKTSYGAVATIKDDLFNKFIKNYEPSKGSFKDLFVNFMYHENGIRISNSNDIVKISSIIDDIADNCKNCQEIYNLFSALLNLDDATKFIEYLSQIKINELTKIINIVLKYPDLANIISKLSDIKNIKYLFSMISNIDNPEKLINRLSLYSEKTKSLKTDELISCYYQIYQKKPSQIVNINGKQTEIKILDFISDGKYYFEKKESELLGKHFQTVEYIVKDKQDQKGIAVASESGNCCYYIFSENQTGLTIINMVDGISSNIIRSDGVRKFLLDNISDFYNFLLDKGFEIIYS
ncbi:MAG: zinc-dependent metalloprotease [Bacteroidales bacterium]|nr:zinc-dependent metalloprotease [Bacteroidales bacterium]